MLLTWTDTADPSWLTDSHRQLIRQSLEWAASTPEELIVGEDRQQDVQVGNVAGLMLATQVRVERDLDLREIAVLVKGPAGKQSRLAIYDDLHNRPGRLVLQTDTAAGGGTGNEFDWARFPLNGRSLPAGHLLAHRLPRTQKSSPDLWRRRQDVLPLPPRPHPGLPRGVAHFPRRCRRVALDLHQR